jgi:hypothetical protein
MREGEVTTIIGVPRLYDALWTAIETRVTTRGAMVRLIWRALLKSANLVQRSTGLRLGRLLFAPIRRGIVARLRLLVSGGARLELETEERLEGHRQVNKIGKGGMKSISGSCCGGSVLPPRCGFRSEDPQRRPGDQMTLKVEVVEHG